MKLSLIVRGQHTQRDDMRERLADDLDLVARAEELGFDALVKGSHYSAHPLQSLQQIPFLAQAAMVAPRLRLVCGLVLLPLHKPLDIAGSLPRSTSCAAASWSSAAALVTATSNSRR